MIFMAHQLGHKVMDGGAVVVVNHFLSLLGVGTSIYLAMTLSGGLHWTSRL